MIPAALGLAGLLAAAGPPGATSWDRFGISQLYPTLPGGRTWSEHWDNDHVRELHGRDPDDPELDAGHGEGTYRIDGRGVLTMRGRVPRLYVDDPAGTRFWDNVEITFYAMRIAETVPRSYAGFMAYARTDHRHDEDLCADRGYGGRMTYDGRMDFEKEIAHHLSSGYVQAGTVKPWPRGIPHRVWLGYKFVVRDVPGGVRLELYLDRTRGRMGGHWLLQTSFVDTGTWGRGAPPCASGVDPAEILTAPGPSVYLRDDDAEIQYQWFSVREITSGMP